MASAHRLILYGKPDCHLCHEAEAMLGRVGRDFALSVEKVDILGDPELEQKYGTAIPVIVLDGLLELEAPLLESELRAALGAG